MANEDKNKNTQPTAKTAVKKVDTAGKKNRNVFKAIGVWFKEMRSELKKVIWPTPKQTMNNTGVALVVMVLCAILIWGFDTLAQAGVQALITLAG